MDKMTWRYATGICLLFLSGWSLATAKTEPKDHYAALLTPGARLLAGEPGKNEFYILGNDEDAPRAPAVKKLPQIQVKNVAAPSSPVVHRVTSNTKLVPHKVHEQVAKTFALEKKVHLAKKTHEWTSYEQAMKAFASNENWAKKAINTKHAEQQMIVAATKKSLLPVHLTKKDMSAKQVHLQPVQALISEKKVHLAKVKTKQTQQLAVFKPVVKAFMPEKKISSPAHLAKKNMHDWASHEHIAKAFVPEKKVHLASKSGKPAFKWVSHQQIMNEFAAENIIRSKHHLASRKVKQVADLNPVHA